MRWLALVALAACNWAFGTQPVEQIDARYFDATTDARVQCPAFGMAPRFSPILRQVIDQNCRSYTVSADTGLAVATCSEGGVDGVYAGPVDQPLVRVPELPAGTQDLTIGEARLSPDGQLLVVSTFDLTNVASAYRTYTLGAQGWVPGPDLPLPQFGNPSVPSRGPDRRVLFYDQNIGKEFRQDTSGAWLEVGDVTFGPAPGVHSVWLSPDALRFVAYEAASSGTRPRLYYADRASRDAPFTAPVELAGVPASFDPFITEDCDRIYMTSVEAIFYAQGD